MMPTVARIVNTGCDGERADQHEELADEAVGARQGQRREAGDQEDARRARGAFAATPP